MDRRLEKDLERFLKDLASKHKIPIPYWENWIIEELESGYEITVYVSIKNIPKPFFLDNLGLAITLQELISNPAFRTEDNKPVFVFFAIPENLEVYEDEETKEAVFIKKGQNQEGLPIDFLAQMHEQALKKLASVDWTQVGMDLGTAYWMSVGLWSLIDKSLKAGQPEYKTLPGGSVYIATLSQRLKKQAKLLRRLANEDFE